MDFIFQIAVLIMSVVIHEVSHGYAASYLGDQTARYEGRLTLNPLKHLDPVGSLLVPAFSYALGGFIIGWAKPVPYNPHNLRPSRWSEAFVAAAGPASNIAIALVFGLVVRTGEILGSQAFLEIVSLIVLINLILAIFNLVPIPPLDGSKIIFALFPERIMKIRALYENFGLVLLIFFIFFFWQFVSPIAFYLFKAITGIGI